MHVIYFECQAAGQYRATWSAIRSAAILLLLFFVVE